MPFFASYTPKGLLQLGGIIVALIVLPMAITNAFVLHILQTVGIYYIAAMGLNILVGYSGQVSLGHAGFYAIGAYTSGLLMLKAGWPFWPAVLAAPLLAAIFGAGLGFLSLRTKGPYLAMITVAFGMVAFFVANQWVEFTGGPAGLYGVPRPALFGHSLGELGYLYLIVTIALLVQLFTHSLLNGKWGRAFRALSLTEVGAATVGINVVLWKTLAFMLSAALAGLAGALFAHQNGYLNSDSFTFDTSVAFLVSVILGGSGTIYGPLVGSTILTVVPLFFAKMSQYHLMFYGGLLLFSLILMPDGVVGTFNSWRAKLGRRSRNKKVQSVAAQVPQTSYGFRAEPLGLTVQRLTKVFGIRTKGSRQTVGLKAVDGVDLEIRPGTVHAIIGPNGSGKSTIVNLIMGIYRPTDGQVKVGDNVTVGQKPHELCSRRVTRTFQNLQVFGELSVLENVLVGFHQHIKSGFVAQILQTRRMVEEETHYRGAAMELLHLVGIEHLATERADSLPYGDQRKLEIARALATRPRILILDEPAAGLNAAETTELTQIIRRIKGLGTTVVLIEHHMDLVMSVSETITVLDYGKKIAEGVPVEIQQNPDVIEAYLGKQGVSLRA